MLAKTGYVCMLSHISCVRLCTTPCTVALQAPLSMEFSKQEYWSGLPFPFPGYLLNPGIKHRSSAFWADSLPSEPLEKPKQLDIHVQKLTLDPLPSTMFRHQFKLDQRPKHRS